MKILKFLIVALSIVAVQCAWAVTLPSTSYYPHSSTDSYSSGASGTDFSIMSGSYLSLGDGESYDVCATKTPGVPSGYGTCEDCCENYFPDDDSTYLQCVNACEQGASLPLDAPLWFMLLLPAAFVILSKANGLAGVEGY